MDGLNLENLRVFSLRTSATLLLQGTILLGWVPLGLRQKSDEESVNCNRGQNLNRGFEFRLSARVSLTLRV